MPSLARSVEELTATNVVSSWVESGCVLVGSALTGVLLTVSGVEPVFALMAAVALVSALLVASVDGPEPVVAGRRTRARAQPRRSPASARSATHPHLRVLLGLLLGEFLLIGAMDILFVVLAIDVLGLGQGWAGYFNAAYGAGGVIGGLAAMPLVGRRYLSPPIAIGVLAVRRRVRRDRALALDGASRCCCSRSAAAGACCSTSAAARCCSARRHPRCSAASSASSRA